MNESSRHTPSSPALLSIASMTCDEVAAFLPVRKVILVPLGGLEAWGALGACGVGLCCVERLARALAEATGFLLAPTVNYGCSTQHKAFEGVAGVDNEVMHRLVTGVLECWTLHGARGIVVIDGLRNNEQAVTQAVRRVTSRKPGVHLLHLSWQNLSEVRSLVARRVPGREFGRAELAALSMAAYLDPSLIRHAHDAATSVHLPDDKTLKSWGKRGHDPQQYRKMFPTGSSSEVAHRFTAELGKEVFDAAVQALDAAVREFLGSIDA